MEKYSKNVKKMISRMSMIAFFFLLNENNQQNKEKSIHPSNFEKISQINLYKKLTKFILFIYFFK